MSASLDTLVERAAVAVREQRLEDALRVLEEVLGQDAQHLKALDYLGFVHFLRGKPAAAEQACRRALAVDPDHAYAHKGLGICLAKQGRVDEGVASLERAIALKPAWLDPHWDLAVVFLEAGRGAEALAAAQRGVQCVPAARARLERLMADIRRRSGT